MRIVSSQCSSALLAFVTIFIAGAAPAQSSAPYPNRPIRMIIPFAPGGASDFVGRIVGASLGPLLGQQIVADNRGGASGNIGMEAAARAAPDGYTIYQGNVGTLAINPGIFPALAIKPLRDFIPVTQVVDVPDILVVHPSVPVKSVKELIAFAKARPGQVPFASPGAGTAGRLEVEYLAQQGVLVPAGTSKEIVDRLYAALMKAMEQPDLKKRLADGAVEIVTSASPAEFGKLIAQETQRWEKVIKEANVVAD
jgi:tripartite-type tricarboxylate transporter receptor subunit TctC